MFYSDTFPQILQSLWLSKGKMLSGFTIGHPWQRRVPQLVYNISDIFITVTQPGEYLIPAFLN